MTAKKEFDAQGAIEELASRIGALEEEVARLARQSPGGSLEGLPRDLAQRLRHAIDAGHLPLPPP